jgi:hypothetical protein
MPRLQRAFTKKYRINLNRAEFGFINKINKERVLGRRPAQALTCQSAF